METEFLRLQKENKLLRFKINLLELRIKYFELILQKYKNRDVNWGVQ
jgi:hypothetical protein